MRPWKHHHHVHLWILFQYLFPIVSCIDQHRSSYYWCLYAEMIWVLMFFEYGLHQQQTSLLSAALRLWQFGWVCHMVPSFCHVINSHCAYHFLVFSTIIKQGVHLPGITASVASAVLSCDHGNMCSGSQCYKTARSRCLLALMQTWPAFDPFLSTDLPWVLSMLIINFSPNSRLFHLKLF